MSVDSTATEKMLRLLRCDDCLTLEELPDFDGPPDYDTLLHVLTDRHRFPNGEYHRGRLIRVPQRAWEMKPLRDALLEQIWKGSSGLAEFDVTHYDVKNTFQEDAMKCYKAHNRPEGSCPDFNADSKRLVPDTRADRKEIGLTMQGAPVIHLCSFCPVRSYMERKARGD